MRQQHRARSAPRQARAIPTRSQARPLGEHSDPSPRGGSPAVSRSRRAHAFRLARERSRPHDPGSASRQARAIRPARKPALWAGTPVRARVGLANRTRTRCTHAPRVVCVCSIRSFDPPSRPSGDPVRSPPRQT